MEADLRIIPEVLKIEVDSKKIDKIKNDIVYPNCTFFESELDSNDNIQDILQNDNKIIFHEKNEHLLNFCIEYVSQNIKFVVNIEKASSVLDLKRKLSIRNESICINEGKLNDNVPLIDVNRITRMLYVTSNDICEASIIKVTCVQDKKEHIIAVSNEESMNVIGNILIEHLYKEDTKNKKAFFVYTPRDSAKPHRISNDENAGKYAAEKGGRLIASIEQL